MKKLCRLLCLILIVCLSIGMLAACGGDDDDDGGSKKKKFVWFDHGAHSHLRIVNLEKYDQEVIEFLNG